MRGRRTLVVVQRELKSQAARERAREASGPSLDFIAANRSAGGFVRHPEEDAGIVLAGRREAGHPAHTLGLTAHVIKI